MALENIPYVDDLLGLGTPPEELGLVQILARTVLVYVAGLVMVRAVRSRFMGKNTTFDVVLGIMFGATLSRAINGSGPVFETILGAALLILLHDAFSAVAARFHPFGVLTKGQEVQLVRGGQTDTKALRRSRLSPEDLREAVRLHGNVGDAKEVEAAYLERNGTVSVIPRKLPKVVDVDVQGGVQTVRIVLEA